MSLQPRLAVQCPRVQQQDRFSCRRQQFCRLAASCGWRAALATPDPLHTNVRAHICHKQLCLLCTGAQPLQPLTALAIGCILWMVCSIGGRALRRAGLMRPVNEVPLLACLEANSIWRLLYFLDLRLHPVDGWSPAPCAGWRFPDRTCP